MGCLYICGLKGYAFESGFGMKNGIDFDHFGLINGLFFTMAWNLGTLFTNNFFLHQECSPSQMFRCHILEHVLKWGIDFLLRSEIG